LLINKHYNMKMFLYLYGYENTHGDQNQTNAAFVE
jgi:hypothetical protein